MERTSVFVVIISDSITIVFKKVKSVFGGALNPKYTSNPVQANNNAIVEIHKTRAPTFQPNKFGYLFASLIIIDSFSYELLFIV